MPKQLQDVLTRNAVYAERLKESQVRKYAKFLREIDRVVRDRLSAEDLTAFNRARLDSLLAEIGQQMQAIHGRYIGGLLSDLRDYAVQQGAFAAKALNQSTPASVFATTATPELLGAAIFTEPLHLAGPLGGKLLRPLIDDWSKGDRAMVTDAIRLGIAQGQTTPEIVKAIRGTKTANFSDGVLAVSDRRLKTVVRTAVQHVGEVARQEVYKANDDIIVKEKWVATLDSATTTQCQSLDGTVWPIDSGPRPPIHPNCRSVMVPVLIDKFEALFSEGATRAARTTDRASRSVQVSAKQTYFDWLKDQPAAFQDDALGPTRARLFREGGLSAERFAKLQLDKTFQPMTLDEMREREPIAFARAGI